MTTFLEFKNLQLETYTRKGEFRNWMLMFDEVSGHEAVRFTVDFLEEYNWDTNKYEPVALDEESARAIKMFFKNTDNAASVLKGFFIKNGSVTLADTDWSAWKVRQTVELF